MIAIERATVEAAPVVVEVLDDCTRAFLGRPTTLDDAKSRIRQGRGPRDAFVAWVLGSSAEKSVAAGFGHVWKASSDEVRAFVRARPAHRGRGVSSALLGEIEAAAKDIAQDTRMTDWRLTVTSWPGDAAAEPFLRTSGFDPERHFLLMRRNLDDEDRARSAKTDWIRTYRPGDDDERLFEGFREAFADHWGNQEVDPETWWMENRDDPASAYDPSLWLVAERAGEFAGFLIARERLEENQPTGWVSLLGVRPTHRGRGIGEALLYETFRRFCERGLRSAALNVDVDNTTTALRLYEKVGMVSHPAFSIWQRRLA